MISMASVVSMARRPRASHITQKSMKCTFLIWVQIPLDLHHEEEHEVHVFEEVDEVVVVVVNLEG